MSWPQATVYIVFFICLTLVIIRSIKAAERMTRNDELAEGFED